MESVLGRPYKVLLGYSLLVVKDSGFYPSSNVNSKPLERQIFLEISAQSSF